MDKYYVSSNLKVTVLNKYGLAVSGNLKETTTEQLDGMYYENESLILLWLGKLPRPKPVSEDGTPVEDSVPFYKKNGANHFNVRFKGQPVATPTGITEIEPITPDFVLA